MKKQTVTMTPGGGNWWRMRFMHWTILAVMFPPIFLILCVFLLNPLWFRDDLLIWFENRINAFSVWRNRMLYRIYLGADPEVWHALKD
jgi:positive regulator of sigma E activity